MPSSINSNENTLPDWIRATLSVLAILFFVTACGLLSTRAYRNQSIPGEVVDARFDKNSAFRDFHNAVYYPVRAFLTGENPYSPSYLEYHPDGLGFPLFYPSTLVIHAPFGMFQVQVAQWIFMATNFLLLLLVVRLVLQFLGHRPTSTLVFGLAGAFLLTRPGILNFYGMQVTMMHVLGCLLALQYGKDKPWLAALGLLLASCKPTFTIPLAILMLCRGNWRSVTLGTLLSLAVGAFAVMWIATQNGGPDAVVAQFKTAYLNVESQPEIPEVMTSWTRLDLYSVLPRWDLITPEGKVELAILGIVILFAATCVLAERNRSQLDQSTGRFGLLSCLAIIISVYHQPYDALLMILPLIAILFPARNSNPICGNTLKGVLILLLAFPMLNLLGTHMVLSRLDILQGSRDWKIIVTANSIALTAAFLLIGLRMMGSRLLDARDQSP